MSLSRKDIKTLKMLAKAVTANDIILPSSQSKVGLKVDGVRQLDTESEGFRFKAQKIFLTYPRTLESMDAGWFRKRWMYEFRKLDRKVGVLDYIFAQETHKKPKGNSLHHVHVYVNFDGNFETENPRIFDISHYSKVYHPNVSSVRNRDKCINYVTKGRNFVTNMKDKDMYPRWRYLLDQYHRREISEYELRVQMGYEVSIGSAAGWKNFEKLLLLYPDPGMIEDEKNSLDKYAIKKLK